MTNLFNDFANTTHPQLTGGHGRKVPVRNALAQVLGLAAAGSSRNPQFFPETALRRGAGPNLKLHTRPTPMMRCRTEKRQLEGTP
ncbi:hypothetical protein [Pseudarthrobacter chlorophenolicus]|uniref:hypothetical protein n=1 Tax=Pseudarthrobacter chlorophenolicus TaxID=85085 RepID=UPI00190FFCD5|nr:hypothetical protein [Pseudarthrobacter chlorophenolicus]